MLCNIGWLKYYQGCYVEVEGEYQRPLNGGRWNKENVGWESENFYDFDGYCYGCFNLPHRGEILNIKKNFGLNHEVSELDGVTVIFVASANDSPLGQGRRIVGWYRNATIYRLLQEDGKDSGNDYYRAKAKAEDCILVPEYERSFVVTHGIRNTKYYKKEWDAEFREYLDYIENYTKGDIFEPFDDENIDVGKVY